MDNYELKMPKMLKKVFNVLMIVGIVLALLFTIVSLSNEDDYWSIVVFGLIIMFVGFLIVLWATKWRIYITKDTITTKYIVKKSRTFALVDIDRAVIGLQNELKIFSNGRKIMTIDRLVINHHKFMATLEARGIPVELEE